MPVKDLGIPVQIYAENACEIFDAIKKLEICQGNTDFQDLIKYKLDFAAVEQFKYSDDEVTAYIQTNIMQSFDDLNVVRHKDCELVFNGDGPRCKICTK